MQKHLLAIGLILTGATGCDNVAWGGIDVQLQSPPAAEEPAADSSDEVTEADTVTKVPGPVLLAGERAGERADLVLVGELLADGLSAFPDPRFPEDSSRLAELSAPGSEWILFSQGVRVGRMVADSSGAADEYCGAPVGISGVVELVPSASDAQRLLALPAADAGGYAYEPYVEHAHDYDQRVASLRIAGEDIRRYGAPWPSTRVLDIREDIQAFQPEGASAPWIAASFVNQDALAVASPGQGAYGLFVIGRPDGDEFVEAFSWFRSVETEGKGVPRYHDHLDWDDDGDSEILLDVFGATRRWFAALELHNGQWVRAFEDSCGSGATAAN
jgi:hypothetical protein